MISSASLSITVGSMPPCHIAGTEVLLGRTARVIPARPRALIAYRVASVSVAAQ